MLGVTLAFRWRITPPGVPHPSKDLSYRNALLTGSSEHREHSRS